MPNDSGPIYLETLMGHRFPVEPWNTYRAPLKILLFRASSI